MINASESIKYTATLPLEYVNELKELAGNDVVPSVNFAIRDAIGEYIDKLKKNIYEEEMKAAAVDKDFISRTNTAHEAFAFADSEVDKEW